MDFTKIRAKGPWVLVEAIKPEREDGLQKSASGLLFIPDGTMEERMGLMRGRALSVGQGIWDEEHECFEVPGFGPGEVIVFRGFLQEGATKPLFLNDDVFFVHLHDVLGIWEPEIAKAA
jgi:hypothetical protein